MTTDETYKYFLRDLVYEIKERKAELKGKNDEFYKGIEFGYNSILETIQNQADGWQIKLSEFGFDDYEKYQSKIKPR